MKDATHLYPVQKRFRYGERPGFKITELYIEPSQQIPWHTHTKVQDFFYVVDGALEIFLEDPKESVILKRGDHFAVPAGRPHLVTNCSKGVTNFVVIGDSHGTGDYDFIPFEASGSK